MKRVVTHILCISLLFTAGDLLYAQDGQVENPSFEEYTECPTKGNELENAEPWYDPEVVWDGVFHHKCSPNQKPGVPRNTFGYQFPRTGNGYASLVLFNNNLTGSRSFLEAPLKAPLEPGKEYYVEFWISRADSVRYAVNRIGIHFSENGTLKDSLRAFVYQPHIEYKDTIITNSRDWIKISGIIYGNVGRNYITIGNFAPQDETDTLAVYDPGVVITPEMNTVARYYIDDITITKITGTEDKSPSEKAINIYPNPAGSQFTFYTEPEIYRDNISRIELLDLSGRKVITAPITQQKTTVKTAAVQPGIYIARIIRNNRIIHRQKIVLIKKD